MHKPGSGLRATWDHRLYLPVLGELCSPQGTGLSLLHLEMTQQRVRKQEMLHKPRMPIKPKNRVIHRVRKIVFGSATLSVFTSGGGCWEIPLQSLCFLPLFLTLQEATWEVWKVWGTYQEEVCCGTVSTCVRNLKPGALAESAGGDALQPCVLRHRKTRNLCMKYWQLEKNDHALLSSYRL